MSQPLTASIALLGRHELSRQVRVSLPFFSQVERNDLFDASVGLRLRLGASTSLAASVPVPVNSDGLRSAVTPTIAFELVL